MNAGLLPILVGSLPFSDVKRGIDAIFDVCPHSPSWPQYPKINANEGMGIQYLEGIPGWRWEGDKIVFKRGEDILDELTPVLEQAIAGDTEPFALTDEYAMGFVAMTERLSQDSQIKVVKGQVIGPITFLLSHKTEDGAYLIQDDVYREMIPRALGLKAQFQVNAFMEKCPGRDYIIFFDEPILSQIGSAVLSLNKDDVKNLISETMSLVEAKKGIHICGNSEWDFILDLPIDVVNFDAFNFGDEFLLYSGAIKKFVDRGGKIALGIVTTDPDALKSITDEELSEKAEKQFASLERILGGREKVRESVFITPSCGMGALSDEQALRVLSLLKSISAK